MDLIDELSNRIIMDGYDTKIIAASFKGVQQVKDSINHGAHSVTAPVAVLKQILEIQILKKQ